MAAGRWHAGRSSSRCLQGGVAHFEGCLDLLQSNWKLYFKQKLCEEAFDKKTFWYVLALPQTVSLICDSSKKSLNILDSTSRSQTEVYPSVFRAFLPLMKLVCIGEPFLDLKLFALDNTACYDCRKGVLWEGSIQWRCWRQVCECTPVASRARRSCLLSISSIMNIPVVICCPFFKFYDVLKTWRVFTSEAATRDSLSFYRMQMSVSIDRLAKACANCQWCCVFGCRERYIYQFSAHLRPCESFKLFCNILAQCFLGYSWLSGNWESEGAWSGRGALHAYQDWAQVTSSWNSGPFPKEGLMLCLKKCECPSFGCLLYLLLWIFMIVWMCQLLSLRKNHSHIFGGLRKDFVVVWPIFESWWFVSRRGFFDWVRYSHT